MKKLLIHSISILLFSTSLFAQIEMNSDGLVGIGANPLTGIDFYTPEAKIDKLGVGVSPSSSYDLYTNYGKINRVIIGAGVSNSFDELEVNGEVDINLVLTNVAAIRYGHNTFAVFIFNAERNNFLLAGNLTDIKRQISGILEINNEISQPASQRLDLFV